MKGNPFLDGECPSDMEQWHGASTQMFGASSTEYGSMTKTTPPHLIHHDTIEKQTWGDHRPYGKPYCGAGMSVGMPVFKRYDWELRNTHYMNGAPLRYCRSCWRNFHVQNGLEVPVQEKFDPVFANYIVWEPREIVEGGTGKRVMPDVILQQRHYGGHDSGPGDVIAYMKKDLKMDGTPKAYGDGMRIALGWSGRPGWAWYEEGVESEAGELRAEIAMHRRKLAEAEKLLYELYEEAQDPDTLAEWRRKEPESVEAPEEFIHDGIRF